MKNEKIAKKSVEVSAVSLSNQILNIRLKAIDEEHDQINKALNYQYRLLIADAIDDDHKEAIQDAYTSMLEQVSSHFISKREEVFTSFEHGSFSYSLNK